MPITAQITFDESRDRAARVISLLLKCAHVDEPSQEMRLDRLVFRLLELDDHEARALASLSGSKIHEDFRTPRHFHAVLESALHALRLWPLFARTHEGEFHRSLCPAAYNERTGEHYPQEMAQWRATYRAMAPHCQMVVATVIWLYQSGADSTWMRRVPCTWRADEAIHYLNDAGCLGLWLELIASYPGW